MVADMVSNMEVDMELDMVADMEVDKVSVMVADMEVDKVADMVADRKRRTKSTSTSTWKSNLVRELVMWVG